MSNAFSNAFVEDDPWALLIEVTLGMRRWWIDVCSGLDLTPVQGMDWIRPIMFAGHLE